MLEEKKRHLSNSLKMLFLLLFDTLMFVNRVNYLFDSINSCIFELLYLPDHAKRINIIPSIYSLHFTS